jgi:hypothetical protein
MILVVVKNPIRPKFADDFPSSSRSSRRHAEPGNICFDWYRERRRVRTCTSWSKRSRTRRRARRTSTPSTSRRQPLLPTLFAEIPEIVNVEVPGGWSRMAEVQAEQ